MKKSMISTIVLLTIIILMASFDLSLDGSPPIRLDPNIEGRALFVCPAASNFWDPMAASFRLFDRYILMGFFFAAILLTFFWGWALYQNLLKDSFNRDAFAKPWGFTKLLFWAGIIMLFVLNTPNRYRMVEVTGHTGDYVLCEDTSYNPKVVPSNSVHAK